MQTLVYGTEAPEKAMTANEAMTLAGMYRRERDDLAERLLVASLYNWILEEDEEEEQVAA